MKKQSKNKPEPKFIAEAEREVAAMYLTLSNLAMLDWIHKGQIHDAFIRANEDLQAETGSNLYSEKQDWDAMIKVGDPYCYDEWQRVRQNYVIN